MTTVKQIERAWNAGHSERLFHQLADLRPEAMIAEIPNIASSTAAAAMAVIRLDELGQSHVPLYATLIRSLLGAQQADGGWGDLALTALCVRALLCGRGNGEAVERGMTYLAVLQKTEGIWPNVPLRRMPEDAAVSVFLLYELGDQQAFHTAVRVQDALDWFNRNERSLDGACRAMWHRAQLRCQMRDVMSKQVSWLAA